MGMSVSERAKNKNTVIPEINAWLKMNAWLK